MRNPSLNKAAVLTAAFIFSTALFAQTRPFSTKISTPSTKDEEIGKKTEAKPAAKSTDEEVEASAPATSAQATTPSPRRLHQHSVGVGIGQTTLLGDYSKYGDDKLTMDLLYAYAASYSFDVLVDAHMSEHKDNSERMRLLGLTTSVKARLFEFDNFSPYVLGGLGFYAPKARRHRGDRYQWTDQKLTFGPNFGGGVDLRLNEEWTIGAMAMLNWPFAVKQDNQADLKGYYFKLLLTLAYSF